MGKEVYCYSCDATSRVTEEDGFTVGHCPYCGAEIQEENINEMDD